jgi:hypothetical protein
MLDSGVQICRRSRRRPEAVEEQCRIKRGAKVRRVEWPRADFKIWEAPGPRTLVVTSAQEGNDVWFGLMQSPWWQRCDACIIGWGPSFAAVSISKSSPVCGQSLNQTAATGPRRGHITEAEMKPILNGFVMQAVSNVNRPEEF